MQREPCMTMNESHQFHSATEADGHLSLQQLLPPATYIQTYIIVTLQTNIYCCQELKALGQGQGLEARGQGQGLANWSMWILEDKEDCQQDWVTMKNGLPTL